MGRAFLYDMFKSRFVYILYSVFFTLAACSSNPNLQTKGDGYLQGEWQQEEEAVNKQLTTYTLYHFRFSCDSFFVAMQTHSKVNYGADTCMKSGLWTEYAKGRYTQHQDTLVMKGFFCNADYSLKNLGGCFRAGVYEDYFKTTARTGPAVKFTSTSSVLPIKLRLIKRINCVPKPL